MAFLSPAQDVPRDALPNDTYEAVITAFDPEVENRFHAQNVAEGKPSDPYQFAFTLTIDEDGEGKGRVLTYWTPRKFSTHPRAKLTNFMRAIDRNFAPENAHFDTAEDFEKAILYKRVRIIVDTYEGKTQSGDAITRNKITGILPTKKADLTAEDVAALVGSGDKSFGYDIDF